MASATTLLAPAASAALDSFIPKPTNHESINHVNTSTEEETNQGRLSFLYRFKRERLSNLRPFSEFFDRNRFNFTTSFQLITQRWNYNLQYFSSNYFLIILGLALYSILTHWILLFAIGFVFGGFYLISRLSNQQGPINIAGFVLSSASLYATYAIGCVVLLLFSGATGAIFWIIGAGAMIILGHAAILEPGIEGDFADNQA